MPSKYDEERKKRGTYQGDAPTAVQPTPGYQSTLPQGGGGQYISTLPEYDQNSKYAADRTARRTPFTPLAPRNLDLPSRFPEATGAADYQREIDDAKAWRDRRQPALTNYQDENRAMNEERKASALQQTRDARKEAADRMPEWTRPAFNAIGSAADLFDRARFGTAPGIAIDRFSKAMAPPGATPDNALPPISTGSKFWDKTADIGGTIAGYTVNPADPGMTMGQVYKGISASPLLTRTMDNVNRALPAGGQTLNRAGTGLTDSLASRGIREGLEQGATGAAWEGYRGLMDPNTNDDLNKVALRAAQGGVMGLGTGLATPFAGAAFRGASDRLRGIDPARPPRDYSGLGPQAGAPEYGGLGLRSSVQSTRTPQAMTRPTTTGAGPLPGAAVNMADEVMGAAQGVQERPSLPRDLAFARPTYNRGKEKFHIDWESDVDKALYVVARTSNRSKRDEDYMQFLRDVFPSKNDAEIRGMGIDVRASLKGYSDEARQGSTDTMRVRDTGSWRKTAAPEPTPPPQAQAPSAPAATANSNFTPNARIREGKAGAGTEVHAYPDPEINAIRYRSADGKVRGYVPVDNVTTHLEQLAPKQMSATRDGGNWDSHLDDTMDDGIDPPRQDRRFYGTLEASDNAPTDALSRVGDRSYERLSNQALLKRADASKADIDSVYNKIVGSGVKLPPLTPDDLVQGQQLVTRLSQMGDHERAALMVERLATGLTEAGRVVQAARLYSKLSPEGAGIFAQNILKKAARPGEKARTLTPQQLANIQQTATKLNQAGEKIDQAGAIYAATEKLTGQKAQAVTKEEQVALRQARADVAAKRKKLTGEQPASPKQAAEKVQKRKRDQIVKALDEEAKQAKDWLKTNKNRLNAVPVAEYKQYTKIAVAHLAKNAVSFVDFSTAMVKQIGERVRPHLKQLYVDSVTRRNRLDKKKLEDYEKALNAAIKGSRLSKEDALNLQVFAKEMSLGARSDRELAMGELQKAFQEMAKPTIGEKYAALETVSMLLNTTTLLKNVGGNTAMMAAEGVSRRLVGSVIDMTRSTLTGKAREIFFRSHVKSQYWENFIKGGKAGWQGLSPDGFETAYELQGLKLQSNKFLKYTVGYMEKALYASMKSFDYANAMHAVNKAMGETAIKAARAQGIKSGKPLRSFVENYVNRYYDDLMESHKQFGEYATFQDTNILSKHALMGKNALNFGKKYGLGDVAMKFVKTPANLIMRTIDYSPLGSVKALYKLVDAGLLKGKFGTTTRDAQMQIARALTGSVAFTGLGFMLADLGVMTGAASGDPKIRDMNEARGMGPYTVNMSALRRYVMTLDKTEAKPKQDDLVLSYDWLQPFASSVAMGATWNTAGKENPQATLGEKTWKSADAAITGLADQSFMSGVQKLFYNPPGDKGTLSGLANLAAGMPQRLVPSSLKQARKLVDNSKRDVNYSDPSTSAVEQVQNASPFEAWGSRDLPAKMDNLGGQSNYYTDNGPLKNAAQVLMNPSNVTRYNDSGARGATTRMYEQTGDTKVLPTDPSKKITISPIAGGNSRVPGKEVELTNEQYARYKQLIAQETETLLQPDAKDTPDVKIRRAADQLRVAREIARNKVIVEYKLYDKVK